MLKDGRVVKPKGAPKDLQMESLGKYKAFFLLTADRDGIGKRGQNKGFAGGKFFAIDPGHSLEGNGKYLQISDDLSFKDTYGKSTKPRFNNFSVFDDDTFFSKMEGVVKLRETAKRGEFQKAFDDYRAAFNPEEEGISDAEKTLRRQICADIDKKEAEFNESLKKILDVSVNNLNLYDDLDDKPESLRQSAIETVANLEKLTSPTTWTSAKGKVALEHLEVIPETRVPWKAALKGDDIVYFTETKMSYANMKQLEDVVTTAGAKFDTDALGVTRITVPVDKAEKFFAVFNEEKVKQITHAAEYMARKDGGSGLKEATIYKPVPYPKPVADSRPLIDLSQLPPYLDFEVDGQVYKFPKIHFQDLLFKSSSVHRPRDAAELRALLSAQVKLGKEVLGALMSGRPGLFEPTNQNIVALTYALHAAALKKGEYMYRGSFTIEDKNGDIARWLDKAEGLYIRTSTHAKPYQTAHVDGHLNMPRGYDVPTGAGDVPLLHDPGRGRAQERRQRKRSAAQALPQVRDVRHLLLDGPCENIRQAGVRRRGHEDARLPVRRRPRVHLPRRLALRVVLPAEGGARDSQGEPHQGAEGRHPVGAEQAPHEVPATRRAPYGGGRPRRRRHQQDDRQHGLDTRPHAGGRGREGVDHGRSRLHVRVDGGGLRQ